MLVAVYPAQPSSPLSDGLLEAGARPVPVVDAAAVAELEPSEGWAALVIEIPPDDAGQAMALARRVRGAGGPPVMIVASRAQVSLLDGPDRYDDFVLTPLDREELRIRLLRLARSGDTAPETEFVRFKDLELNPATYQARLGKHHLDLTFMEYELLRFFAGNPGRVWSREQLLSRVWGYDYFGGARTVDVHVRRLRAKLGEERASWITTVRSVGYRFG
jgi:DNA-binding response OmpR family regulator